MKKRIRLTESDLEKLIGRVIKESDLDMEQGGENIGDVDMEQGGENIGDVINYIEKLYKQLASLNQIMDRFFNDVDGIDHFSDIIEDSDLSEDEKDELLDDLSFLYEITDSLFDLENKYFRKY